MAEPRPQPSAPPTPPEAATGEWSAVTAREAPSTPDTPTVTASGQPAGPPDLGIPNPFGRYTITRLLGRGGMGAVFLAHDPQLDRSVALKIPNFSGTLTDGQKQRFFREARSIAALRHPNICPVYDADEEQGVLYLTMHYIEGQPLATLIDRGPMPPEKAIDLVRRVADAMQAAHLHGTVHRDLKPANIMIDRTGQPVVMDFGLARETSWAEDSRQPGASAAVRDQGLTQHGSVLGTPAYMPPEQARGEVTAIGPQSDVYSLGVILYELLTGRRPFAADDTAELIQRIVNDPPPRLTEFYPWIDPKIESACLKALAKNPADRFTSMAQFAAALEDVVDPKLELVLPPPLPLRSPTPQPVNRSRWLRPLVWIGIVVTLLLVLCVGAPTAAIWILINRVTDKVKDLKDSQAESEAEWKAITDLWPAPAADARPDTLLPPTFGDGRYRLRTADPAPPDAELGITVAGQRGVYDGPDGEVEVRFFRCQEAEAKAIQQQVHAFAQARLNRTSVNLPGSKREKTFLSQQNSTRRTVSFGFQDASGLNTESGKLWYGGGWLYWFRTTDPLSIEWFPSKFLMEVGKRASK